QVEAAQVLLRLGERAVRRDRLAVLNADGRRLRQLTEVGAGLRLRVHADRHVLLRHRLLLFLAECLPATVLAVDQECVLHCVLLRRCRHYDERATPISTSGPKSPTRRPCRAVRSGCRTSGSAHKTGSPAGTDSWRASWPCPRPSLRRPRSRVR